MTVAAPERNIFTAEVCGVRLWLRPERCASRSQERAFETVRRFWRRWARWTGYIYSTPVVRRETDYATGRDYLVSTVRCLKPPVDEEQRGRLQGWLNERYGGAA